MDAKNRDDYLKKACKFKASVLNILVVWYNNFLFLVEFFDKVLRLDGYNVIGATGAGICLAEMGKYTEAKEIFTQVKPSLY